MAKDLKIKTKTKAKDYRKDECPSGSSWPRTCRLGLQDSAFNIYNLTANLCAHRSRPRYVVYDADFTECLARLHRIEDSESVLGHDFDDAVLDEEYLVSYIVFAHDVLVTHVVGGLQATCYGTNDVCVRVTEQSDAAIQYRVTLSLLLSKP